jgi:hypothetical protein
MSKLIITIDLDNDAFQEWGGQAEVARILRKYADQVSEWGVGKCQLLDINGNRVGGANVTRFPSEGAA